MRTFTIALENPSASYFAGQIINGRVILDLETERKTSGFKLTCTGKASVHWSESRQVSSGTGSNRTTRTQTRHYRSSENYFDFKIYLAGSSGGPEIRIPPGYQEYPFSFQLPLGIPSSFAGNHGYVQYSLNATVKKSWGFDKKISSPFTVNGLLDLNTWPGAGSPYEFTKSKNLGCCCCKSGPISFTFKTNRTGYVPGECLQFLTEISNLSNKPVEGISLKIKRRVTFHAEGRTKSQSDKVSEYRGPGVPPGETEIWRPTDIRIPPVPPTNLAGCRIIDVNYIIEIELELPAGHFNLEQSGPLVIGTIPFRNNFAQLMPPQPPHPISVVQPGDGPAPSITPSAPPLAVSGYPDLPPPTYEATFPFTDKVAEAGGDLPSYGDAVKAGADEKAEDGKQPSAPFDPTFVPKYATYGWT